MEKAPPRPLIIPQRDLESQRPLVLAPRSSAQATWATVIYSELDSVPIQASNAGFNISAKKTTAVKVCKTELDFFAAVSMRAVKLFPQSVRLDLLKLRFN